MNSPMGNRSDILPFATILSACAALALALLPISTTSRAAVQEKSGETRSAFALPVPPAQGTEVPRVFEPVAPRAADSGVPIRAKAYPGLGGTKASVTTSPQSPFVATAGAESRFGALTRLDADGSVRTVHEFAGADGSAPVGGLVPATDGWVYGVTSAGGPADRGVLYRLRPDGAGFVVLYAFTGGVDGGRPLGGLVEVDGTLYGTASEGGADGRGVLFAVTAGGAVRVVHAFTERQGAGPAGTLAAGADGSLYGTTVRGGADDLGTIYRLTRDGDLSTLVALERPQGARPETGLLWGGDGWLYGAAAEGGPRNGGTLFRVSVDGGAFEPLHAFGGRDGRAPTTLMLAPDGRVYGTTLRGGAGDRGVAFRASRDGARFEVLRSLGVGDEAKPGVVLGSDGRLLVPGPAGSGLREVGRPLPPPVAAPTPETKGASSAAFSVTNTNDSGAGSLRQAIIDANAAAGTDTITISATGTINLQSALPNLDTSVSITGPGASLLTVRRDAGGEYRIFTVTGGATVTISGLTVTNGQPAENTYGGGLSLDNGSLTIDGLVVTGNTAYGELGWSGGVDQTGGSLTILNSHIYGNTATLAGGIGSAFGALVIQNTTISGNSAAGQAGGLEIQDCASATLTNVTISGNTTSNGTGAYLNQTAFSSSSPVSMVNLTIARNTAPSGSAGLRAYGTGAATSLLNTLVAENSGNNFVSVAGGTLTSLGNNFDSDGTSGFPNGVNGNISGTLASEISARLGALQSNGGLPPTHALMFRSRAIDAGAASGAPATDARQQGRPSDGNGDGATAVDIGAFEVLGTCVTNTNDSGPGSLRQAILDNEALGGGFVCFNIPGPGPHTIVPVNGLPFMTRTITIDGYTQPGASANTLVAGTNAVLLIVLNGGAAGNAPGIMIQGRDSTIRGLVVNGFTGPSAGVGIWTIFAAASNNWIHGNYVGTNAAGTAIVPNTWGYVAQWGANGNRVGTDGDGVDDPGERNLLSGSSLHGILMTQGGTTGNVVAGNYAGTDASGTGALANGVAALVGLDGSNNVIGGTSAVLANRIAFNANGVGLAQPGTGNAVLGNSILSNGTLGIDLGVDGVTPNDSGDGDTGINNLQNFPVLTSAVAGAGNTVVQGTLESTPSTTFRVELFSSTTCDPSGNGEGETFQGFVSASTDASGNATFSATLPLIPAGHVVTATTTDPTNNTSEFSACRTVLAEVDLGIDKTDSPDPVSAGDNLTYTISVINTGPNTATNASWSDALPAGTTFVSNSGASGWTCTNPPTNTNGTVTCTAASLASGDFSVFTVVVQVDPAQPNGSTLTNTATVTAGPSDVDSNTGNDTATVTTTVGALANLSITKTDSPDPVVTGSNITYTITVSNAGPAVAQSVTVTDTLPPNTTFVSCSSSTGTCGGKGNNRTVTWATLDPGASVTATIVATANCSVANGTVITNTATVTSATTDPATDDNMATTTTTASNPAPVITCPANITTTSNTPTGAVVTYANPTVTDNCPNPTVVCSPASGSFFNEGTTTVTCTATDSGGATASCQFTVTVNNPPFNLCMRDDVTGDYLRAVRATGYWEFVIVNTPSTADDTVYFGTADSVVSNAIGVTITDWSDTSWRMTATWSTRTLLGRARILIYSTQTEHVITDNNYADSSCP